MSNDVVIKVENLSKLYRLGELHKQTNSFREKITNSFRHVFSSFRSAPSAMPPAQDAMRSAPCAMPSSSDDSIWALRDVSFEVKRGEIIGIIGRNGAGKSTLLKILSRITKPTEGTAWINGRVGSLLEVGTGFHQELTGRENIFLNGAILGMTKAEIKRKFDEIVGFAEIENFIDTPVKRYSSGMYVRLAFAVAAHLEPEILLVDEVLAVGDAAFQKKCLGKMGDIAKEGRTVLFVSHNMVSIQSLCEKVIMLDNGKVIAEGEPGPVVSHYLQSSFSTLTEQIWSDIETAPGNQKVRIHRVCVRPEHGSFDPITMQTPFVVEVEFWNKAPGAYLHITLHVYTEQQIVAFTTGSSRDPTWRGRPYPLGLFRSVCKFPGNLLNSGMHRVLVLIIQNGKTIIYRQEDAVLFEVLDLDKRQGSWHGKEPGVVQPILEWTTEFLNSETKGLSSTIVKH